MSRRWRETGKSRAFLGGLLCIGPGKGSEFCIKKGLDPREGYGSIMTSERQDPGALDFNGQTDPALR